MAIKPTKPTVPQPSPLRTQPPAEFDTNMGNSLGFQPTLVDYIDTSMDFMDDRANAALAAALGGDLPPLTGKGGNFLRVNTGATAAEFRTPAQVLVDLGISGHGDTATTITNLNTLSIGGTYYAASTATGLPLAEASVVIHQPADTTARAVQEVVSLTSGRRWWRVETGGTWGAWVEVNAPADNRIINGAFDFWQRGASFTALGAYGADRWVNAGAGGTVTMSRQAFTIGDRLGGNTPQFFLRQSVSGQTLAAHAANVMQRIESVASYSGETITVLGWARRSSGSGNMAVDGFQFFGTGGSPSAAVNLSPATVTLGSAWTPFAVVLSVPSIAGKVAGTNGDSYLAIRFWASAGSDFNANTNSLGLQTIGVDLWGIHIRPGVHTAAATDLYRAPELGPELARCQRYYEVVGGAATPAGSGSSTIIPLPFKVRKRASPSVARTGDFSSSAEAGTTAFATNTGPGGMGDWSRDGVLAGKASLAFIGGFFTADAEL